MYLLLDLLIFLSVLPACIYADRVCLVPPGVRRANESPGKVLKDGCEPP